MTANLIAILDNKEDIKLIKNTDPDGTVAYFEPEEGSIILCHSYFRFDIVIFLIVTRE